MWAPNAAAVSVVGDFNGWSVDAAPMKRTDAGIWELRLAGIEKFAAYKYAVTGADGKTTLKSDPFARHFETAPANASKVYSSDYEWGDGEWRENRLKADIYASPVNI